MVFEFGICLVGRLCFVCTVQGRHLWVCTDSEYESSNGDQRVRAVSCGEKAAKGRMLADISPALLGEKPPLVWYYRNRKANAV